MKISNNSPLEYQVTLKSANGEMNTTLPPKARTEIQFDGVDKFDVTVKCRGAFVKVPLQGKLESGCELTLLGPTPHTWVCITEECRKKAYEESMATSEQMAVVTQRIDLIRQGKLSWQGHTIDSIKKQYSTFECICGDLYETGFMTPGQFCNAYKRVLDLPAGAKFESRLNYLETQGQEMRDWSQPGHFQG